ncbi:MAG: 4-aminobutyrate--2-oxoglutarate transaminase [Bifidobacteriaceae bacterium]|jgi:4-aminobutyrate aminotransferase/(S)-3-amino-2-methylpropionate transaminase|nr:4-aminobutyrate--2-oxoglutarate transaminase [Bifidobacteriaceae bacterium]
MTTTGTLPTTATTSIPVITRIEDVPQIARKIVTAIPGPLTLALQKDYDRYVSPGVGQHEPIFADSASGATITDVDGNRYIDLAAGIAVASVGNTAPEVSTAVQKQAAKLLHTCFATTPYAGYVEVCKKLAEHTPGDFPKKSLLLNSGAEAVENAVKIARKYSGKSAVIVMENAFHGRTNLTMSMTTKANPYKAGFGGFAPDIYRVPFSYPLRDQFGADGAAAARKAVEEIALKVDPSDIAAIIAEPVQGEGGFIVPAPGFLEGLLDWAHKNGIIYISDEIQSGFCRTGEWFAGTHFGIVPDLITTAKALGGGMPISAVTGRAEIMDSVQAGGLGGTYSGNPVSCAAALASIDIMERKNLPARAAHIGELATELLAPLAASSVVAEVRGLGAMIGVEFVRPGTLEPNGDLVKRIMARAPQAGLIILSCGIYGNVIRLLPPLTISDAELTEALTTLCAVAFEEAAE